MGVKKIEDWDGHRRQHHQHAGGCSGCSGHGHHDTGAPHPCPNCGDKAKANGNCPSCKKPTQPEWVICPYCAKWLKDPPKREDGH